jgi:hypothetical protein
MGLKPATLPRLPASLLQLSEYLMNRDLGAPSADPIPQPIATAAVAGSGCQAFEIDTLSWLYSQPVGVSKRRADGFILGWENADTPNPAGALLRLSIDARQHQMVWPAGATRSYSLATFRNTWQGEQLGTVKQADSWKAVATTAIHVLPVVPVIETVTGISGASHTIANMIPAGCYPIAVFVENLTAITGPPASYMVGTALNPDWWGAAVSVADGATNGLAAFTVLGLGALITTATGVVLTANTSNFTGGDIEVRLLYADPALC